MKMHNARNIFAWWIKEERAGWSGLRRRTCDLVVASPPFLQALVVL